MLVGKKTFKRLIRNTINVLFNCTAGSIDHGELKDSDLNDFDDERQPEIVI